MRPTNHLTHSAAQWARDLGSPRTLSLQKESILQGLEVDTHSLEGVSHVSSVPGTIFGCFRLLSPAPCGSTKLSARPISPGAQ